MYRNRSVHAYKQFQTKRRSINMITKEEAIREISRRAALKEADEIDESGQVVRSMPLDLGGKIGEGLGLGRLFDGIDRLCERELTPTTSKGMMKNSLDMLHALYQGEEMNIVEMMEASDKLAVRITGLLNDTDFGKELRDMLCGNGPIETILYNYLEEVVMARANHVGLAPEKLARILDDLRLCNPDPQPVPGPGLDDLAK
jgi:hypothetical protein